VETAVPYAVDEQMRVEALRAAVAINRDGSANTVTFAADELLSWLLDERVVGLPNAVMEGSD
jgi:hypothetical protein